MPTQSVCSFFLSGDRHTCTLSLALTEQPVAISRHYLRLLGLVDSLSLGANASGGRAGSVEVSAKGGDKEGAVDDIGTTISMLA